LPATALDGLVFDKICPKITRKFFEYKFLNCDLIYKNLFMKQTRGNAPQTARASPYWASSVKTIIGGRKLWQTSSTF
jgi:hypothetical protein